MKPHALLAAHQRAIGCLELIRQAQDELATLEDNSHAFSLPWHLMPIWATFRGAKTYHFADIETKKAVIARLQRSYALILQKINELRHEKVSY